MAKSAKKERPGVVMYFDLLKTLPKLSEAARGRFLMACLEYGKERVEPCYDDLGLEDRIRFETLWEQTAPRIDKDGEGWRDGIIQRKYGGYCKAEKDKGRVPMLFEDYKDWYNRVEEKMNESDLYRVTYPEDAE